MFHTSLYLSWRLFTFLWSSGSFVTLVFWRFCSRHPVMDHPQWSDLPVKVLIHKHHILPVKVLMCNRSIIIWTETVCPVLICDFIYLEMFVMWNISNMFSWFLACFCEAPRDAFTVLWCVHCPVKHTTQKTVNQSAARLQKH